MARRDSDGESKQGLVVALVAFVILFVLTAIIAFLGYSDASYYKNEFDAKSRQLDSANKNLNKEKVRVGLYTLAVFNNEADRKALDKNQDVLSFDALKREPSIRQAIDDEVKKLKGITWEPGM